MCGHSLTSREWVLGQEHGHTVLRSKAGPCPPPCILQDLPLTPGEVPSAPWFLSCVVSSADLLS